MTEAPVRQMVETKVMLMGKKKKKVDGMEFFLSVELMHSFKYSFIFYLFTYLFVYVILLYGKPTKFLKDRQDLGPVRI